MDDILRVVDEFKGAVETAMEEGRSPQEVLANMHMIFHGPPGTGKTTCAKRFAIMFKQLGLLPRGDYEYVTPSNLMGRYVGDTGNNTLEAMRRAKGGVLFIDEAYGMMPRRANFGGDIMQALLDNVTTEEFKGKIIVILGGYEADINELFSVNPGFQSRFDKKRIEFKEWTAAQAAEAVCRRIQKDGKTIVPEASAAMEGYFHIVSDLPNWASARDAFEIVHVQIETKRAYRSSQINKERREKAALSGAAPPKPTYGKKGAASQADGTPLVPYELVDVRAVFEDLIKSRGGDINADPSKKRGMLRPITNDMGLRDALTKSKKESKPFVLLFHSDSCPHSVDLLPDFVDLADERCDDAMFGIVNSETGDSVFRSQKVDSYPRVRIYVAGSMLLEIKGRNVVALRQGLERAVDAAKQMGAQGGGVGASNVPQKQKDAEDAKKRRDADESRKAAENAAPLRPVTKEKFKKNTYESSDDEGPDDDISDDDIQAALEEAFNELGWTLDQIKEALESSSFPPQEVIDLIMQKFPGKKVNPAKIASVLGKQKDPLLQKIKELIRSREKAKTDQETMAQETLKKIGKCCMGFDWLRRGDGYQCAGGSHFCSDADIEQAQMMGID